MLDTNTQKRSHLGKAGELAVMSEFLFRGYNVAHPYVDVGDDVFVVDDRDGSLHRIQVKSAILNDRGRVQLSLIRSQLEAKQKSELTYVFALRRNRTWDFIVIPRLKLLEIRTDFEQRSRVGRGRKPITAKNEMTLWLEIGKHDVIGWGVSFQAYFNDWSHWPEVKDGPGAIGHAFDRATDHTSKPPQAL